MKRNKTVMLKNAEKELRRLQKMIPNPPLPISPPKKVLVDNSEAREKVLTKKIPSLEESYKIYQEKGWLPKSSINDWKR